MRDLELLIRAIVERFPSDPSQPSVTLSFIQNNLMQWVYYASIIRYKAAYGQSKEVFLIAEHQTLEGVVKELTHGFLVSLGHGSAINALRENHFKEKT
mgnify:FL=1